ncbi:hypothetical protein BGX27_001879 [Mortierella sp. AM989]|nr:hypothetical protein BGX27_001879 [Mortierella sp. AM989]
MARAANPEVLPIESYHQWQERICRWADTHFVYPHALDVVLHLDVYIRKNIPRLVKLQPNEEELWAAEEAVDELVSEHYRARIPSPRDDTLLKQRYKREVMSIQPGTDIFPELEPASGPHIPFRATFVQLLEDNKPAKRQRLGAGPVLGSSEREDQSREDHGNRSSSVSINIRSNNNYNIHNNCSDDYKGCINYVATSGGDNTNAHYSVYSAHGQASSRNSTSSSSHVRDSDTDNVTYFNNPSPNNSHGNTHQLSSAALHAGLTPRASHVKSNNTAGK